MILTEEQFIDWLERNGVGGQIQFFYDGEYTHCGNVESVTPLEDSDVLIEWAWFAQWKDQDWVADDRSETTIRYGICEDIRFGRLEMVSGKTVIYFYANSRRRNIVHRDEVAGLEQESVSGVPV